MSRNIKEEVTQNILNELENGIKPWEIPWDKSSCPSGIPANFSTGKKYRGVNIVGLWLSLHKNGFKSNNWMTFKQTKERGGSVKEGSVGTKIYFYELKSRDVTVRNDKGQLVKDVETYPLLKQYTVFNLDQIEGIEKPMVEIKEPDFSQAEQIISACKVKLEISGTRAFYSPSRDLVNMPACEFRSEETFYATLLHEITHWTGHEDRCNRDFGKRFGDNAYAFEELVAEMGSAFLMAHLGIKQEIEHHAAYIDHWIGILKKDKAAIFTAAAKASDAFDYILGTVASEQTETSSEAA